MGSARMRLEDKLAQLYGPVWPIMEWVFWALGALSLVILVTFPIVCLISWTSILGSRFGWWGRGDTQERHK